MALGTPNISAVQNLTAAGNLTQDFGYAPPGHDAGDGMIGDTVFLDMDGDGVYDPGEGMEGVIVRLYDTNGNILAAVPSPTRTGSTSSATCLPAPTWCRCRLPRCLPG